MEKEILPNQRDISPEQELGVLLGIGSNAECSVMASDTVNLVHEILNPVLKKPAKIFYVVGKGGEVIKTKANFLSIGRDGEHTERRNIDFVLAKEDKKHADPKLLAVTRGDIAFTMATFARRQGSECDYIQIGEDVDDKSLVVTSRDDYSRIDFIKDLRTMLHPFSLPMVNEFNNFTGPDLLAQSKTTQVQSTNTDQKADSNWSAASQIRNNSKLDEKIDLQLGVVDVMTEQILKNIGSLACSGKTPIQYVRRAELSNGHDTKLIVTIDMHESDSASTDVKIKIRPASQDEGSDDIIFDKILDRAGIVEIKNISLGLLSILLNQAITAIQPKVIGLKPGQKKPQIYQTIEELMKNHASTQNQ